MKIIKSGKKYKIDCEIDGKRIVDIVTTTESNIQKEVLCYSPYLRSNVLIKVNELKELK